MELKIDKLRGTNIILHCKTQEEWNEVSSMCGINWGINFFKLARNASCIYPFETLFSSLEYAKTCEEYTIIPASDFIAANRKEVQKRIAFTSEISRYDVKFDYVSEKTMGILIGSTAGEKHMHTVLNAKQISALRTFLNQLEP